MALHERNSALHWAATRPEDNTPATAVAVGHFVQVALHPPICRSGSAPDSSRETPVTETTWTHSRFISRNGFRTGARDSRAG